MPDAGAPEDGSWFNWVVGVEVVVVLVIMGTLVLLVKRRVNSERFYA